jgi:hypothetical protein
MVAYSFPNTKVGLIILHAQLSFMPVATVKNGTLRFAYEDSGPLNGLYTTLVMVHGTGFHNGEQGAVVLLGAG